MYTSEELMKISSEGRYELLEGVLYDMSPSGEEHGFIVSNIGSVIHNFVKANKLGITTGAETGYKLSSNPDTVKAPDVAFKSKERLAMAGMSKSYSPVMPELVVEVNSPSDSYVKVLKKVALWLKAGVIEVWIVDPEDKSVALYTSEKEFKIFNLDEEISGSEALPGFKCKVRDIFEL